MFKVDDTTSVRAAEFALEYIKHESFFENASTQNRRRRFGAYCDLGRHFGVSGSTASVWEKRFCAYFYERMSDLVICGITDVAHFKKYEHTRTSRWLEAVERKLNYLPLILSERGKKRPVKSPGYLVRVLTLVATRHGSLCATAMYRDVKRALRVSLPTNELHAIWVRAQRVCMRALWMSTRAGDCKHSAPAPPAWDIADLVLLHTDVDTQRLLTQESVTFYEESRALIFLWELVLKHRVEDKAPPQSNVRAQRWTKAWQEYRDSGRVASIIVLQRRWHELKLQARARIHAYWATLTQASKNPTPIIIPLAAPAPLIPSETKDTDDSNQNPKTGQNSKYVSVLAAITDSMEKTTTSTTQLGIKMTQMPVANTQGAAAMTQSAGSLTEMNGNSTQIDATSTQINVNSTPMAINNIIYFTLMDTISTQTDDNKTQMDSISPHTDVSPTPVGATSAQMNVDSTQIDANWTQMDANTTQMNVIPETAVKVEVLDGKDLMTVQLAPLHLDILRKYPHIATSAFVSWADRVDVGYIVTKPVGDEEVDIEEPTDEIIDNETEIQWRKRKNQDLFIDLDDDDDVPLKLLQTGTKSTVDLTEEAIDTEVKDLSHKPLNDVEMDDSDMEESALQIDEDHTEEQITTLETGKHTQNNDTSKLNIVSKISTNVSEETNVMTEIEISNLPIVNKEDVDSLDVEAICRMATLETGKHTETLTQNEDTSKLNLVSKTLPNVPAETNVKTEIEISNLPIVNKKNLDSLDVDAICRKATLEAPKNTKTLSQNEDTSKLNLISKTSPNVSVETNVINEIEISNLPIVNKEDLDSLDVEAICRIATLQAAKNTETLSQNEDTSKLNLISKTSPNVSAETNVMTEMEISNLPTVNKEDIDSLHVEAICRIPTLEAGKNSGTLSLNEDTSKRNLVSKTSRNVSAEINVMTETEISNLAIVKKVDIDSLDMEGICRITTLENGNSAESLSQNKDTAKLNLVSENSTIVSEQTNVMNEIGISNPNLPIVNKEDIDRLNMEAISRIIKLETETLSQNRDTEILNLISKTSPNVSTETNVMTEMEISNLPIVKKVDIDSLDVEGIFRIIGTLPDMDETGSVGNGTVSNIDDTVPIKSPSSSENVYKIFNTDPSQMRTEIIFSDSEEENMPLCGETKPQIPQLLSSKVRLKDKLIFADDDLLDDVAYMHIKHEDSKEMLTLDNGTEDNMTAEGRVTTEDKEHQDVDVDDLKGRPKTPEIDCKLLLDARIHVVKIDKISSWKKHSKGRCITNVNKLSMCELTPDIKPTYWYLGDPKAVNNNNAVIDTHVIDNNRQVDNTEIVMKQLLDKGTDTEIIQKLQTYTDIEGREQEKQLLEIPTKIDDSTSIHDIKAIKEKLVNLEKISNPHRTIYQKVKTRLKNVDLEIAKRIKTGMKKAIRSNSVVENSYLLEVLKNRTTVVQHCNENDNLDTLQQIVGDTQLSESSVLSISDDEHITASCQVKKIRDNINVVTIRKDEVTDVAPVINISSDEEVDATTKNTNQDSDHNVRVETVKYVNDFEEPTPDDVELLYNDEEITSSDVNKSTSDIQINPEHETSIINEEKIPSIRDYIAICNKTTSIVMEAIPVNDDNSTTKDDLKYNLDSDSLKNRIVVKHHDEVATSDITQVSRLKDGAKSNIDTGTLSISKTITNYDKSIIKDDDNNFSLNQSQPNKLKKNFSTQNNSNNPEQSKRKRRNKYFETIYSDHDAEQIDNDNIEHITTISDEELCENGEELSRNHEEQYNNGKERRNNEESKQTSREKCTRDLDRRKLRRNFLKRNRHAMRAANTEKDKVVFSDSPEPSSGEDLVQGKNTSSKRKAKKVKLPDIEEVRRVNRSILTAQVAPIPSTSDITLAADRAASWPVPINISEEAEPVAVPETPPTEEQVLHLITELSSVAPAACCDARRQIYENDARRLDSQEPVQIHTHTAEECSCCCAQLSRAPEVAKSLDSLRGEFKALHDDINVILAKTGQRLYSGTPQFSLKRKQKKKKLTIDVPSQNAADDTTSAHSKKKRKVQQKPPTSTTPPETRPPDALPPVQEDTASTASKINDLEEWNRQKNINKQYFMLNASSTKKYNNNLAQNMSSSNPALPQRSENIDTVENNRQVSKLSTVTLVSSEYKDELPTGQVRNVTFNNINNSPNTPTGVLRTSKKLSKSKILPTSTAKHKSKSLLKSQNKTLTNNVMVIKFNNTPQKSVEPVDIINLDSDEEDELTICTAATDKTVSSNRIQQEEIPFNATNSDDTESNDIHINGMTNIDEINENSLINNKDIVSNIDSNINIADEEKNIAVTSSRTQYGMPIIKLKLNKSYSIPESDKDNEANISSVCENNKVSQAKITCEKANNCKAKDASYVEWTKQRNAAANFININTNFKEVKKKKPEPVRLKYLTKPTVDMKDNGLRLSTKTLKLNPNKRSKESPMETNNTTLNSGHVGHSLPVQPAPRIPLQPSPDVLYLKQLLLSNQRPSNEINPSDQISPSNNITPSSLDITSNSNQNGDDKPLLIFTTATNFTLISNVAALANGIEQNITPQAGVSVAQNQNMTSQPNVSQNSSKLEVTNTISIENESLKENGNETISYNNSFNLCYVGIDKIALDIAKGEKAMKTMAGRTMFIFNVNAEPVRLDSVRKYSAVLRTDAGARPLLAGSHLLLTALDLLCAVPHYWTLDKYESVKRIVINETRAETDQNTSDAGSSSSRAGKKKPSLAELGANASGWNLPPKSPNTRFRVLTAVSGTAVCRSLVAGGAELLLLDARCGRLAPLHVTREGARAGLHADVDTPVLSQLAEMFNSLPQAPIYNFAQ